MAFVEFCYRAVSVLPVGNLLPLRSDPIQIELGKRRVDRLEPLTPTLPATGTTPEQAGFRSNRLVESVLGVVTVVSVVVKTVVWSTLVALPRDYGPSSANGTTPIPSGRR